MKTSFLALVAVLALPLTIRAADKTDFNALKNHGRSITAWINKVSDQKNRIEPAEIIKSAYSPSHTGVSPYESISAAIPFYEDFAAREMKSEVAEEKALGLKARAISDRLKRMKRGLEVSKKADASTVGKSLETSQGYRELLNLRAKGPEVEMNFDEIVIAAARKAQANSSKSAISASSRVNERPAAGSR